MPDSKPVARALLSVSDKTGLVSFASRLHAAGVALVSTGGTCKALTAAGLPVMDVADLTGFPEMMDGRLKTLHPKVHGGLLAIRENPEHEAAMLAHGIAAIDLLAVNLYPFETALAQGLPFQNCIEQIDIGGPAMIRAGAKNQADVAVLTDPQDYGAVMLEIEATGRTSLATRRRLAAKAFARVAAYDAAISNWLLAETSQGAPRWRAFGGILAEELRYGENPHQWGAFYRGTEARPGVASARQVLGKQLSYNNIADADAAFECVAEFEPSEAAAAVIVKHANPCGAARGANLREAYEKALRCDPVSAFGGIVALNRRLDAEAARAIVEIFTEVIIAPDADEEAIAVIAAKRNLRLLLAGALPDPAAPGVTFRAVAGGFLAQARDSMIASRLDLKVVTKRAPDAREMADLRFAFAIAKHVKSNAIVYARDGATTGIGAGQMSRLDSAHIAGRKAQEAGRAAGLGRSPAQGSVAASDAFFPFADGLAAAVEAGVTAVIQPGGSLRDEEVIQAADGAGLAMVFTGYRHFRH